ncbi:hypothetical protein, partial [Shigella sonnei]|uniref:hypothetical protein n=1 Tax=Shigella sonnei TaxID=624 RepID=UPI00092D4ECF
SKTPSYTKSVSWQHHQPSVGLKDIIKQQNWLANALIPMYCQFLIVKAIFMTCLNAQSRLPE